MKIQIFSDLHADVRHIKNIVVPDDVVLILCAGDVCEGLPEAFDFMKRFNKYIITVAGNHSFYNRDINEEINKAYKEAALIRSICYLENAVLEWTTPDVKIRIIGATLWTDYKLYGKAYEFTCMQLAKQSLNDHQAIKNNGSLFTPQDAAKYHEESLEFIVEQLSMPFDGKTIIITHHAPSERSVHPKYNGQMLNTAFASNLEGLIEKYQPDLWIHGHTHSSADYHIGKTRVICNPHGYGNENPEFNPSLVIDL